MIQTRKELTAQLPSFIGILDCPQPAYLITQVPPHTVAAASIRMIAMEDLVVQKMVKHSRMDIKRETNLEMKLSGIMGTRMALVRMAIMRKHGHKEVLAVKMRATQRRDQHNMAGKHSCTLFS